MTTEKILVLISAAAYATLLSSFINHTRWNGVSAWIQIPVGLALAISSTAIVWLGAYFIGLMMQPYSEPFLWAGIVAGVQVLLVTILGVRVVYDDPRSVGLAPFANHRRRSHEM